jgi:hypothetical protein
MLFRAIFPALRPQRFQEKVSVKRLWPIQGWLAVSAILPALSTPTCWQTNVRHPPSPYLSRTPPVDKDLMLLTLTWINFFSSDVSSRELVIGSCLYTQHSGGQRQDCETYTPSFRIALTTREEPASETKRKQTSNKLLFGSTGAQSSSF